MGIALIKDVIDLVEQFQEGESGKFYQNNIDGFKQWIFDEVENSISIEEPDWEGKEKGRSPESIISTLLVHMNRYAKTYSRSAIPGSPFSTQDEFIFLINLKAFGPMTKMELIKKNIQEKPAGMKIINRLINQGWVKQIPSLLDKRSKILELTSKGTETLEAQMENIRRATRIVTGDLTRKEKMQLISILKKLEDFHQPVFSQNYHPSILLDKVNSDNKNKS